MPKTNQKILDDYLRRRHYEKFHHVFILLFVPSYLLLQFFRFQLWLFLLAVAVVVCFFPFAVWAARCPVCDTVRKRGNHCPQCGGVFQLDEFLKSEK